MTSLNGLIGANLPIFDGKNYYQWCVKMDVIFGFQDVAKNITKGI